MSTSHFDDLLGDFGDSTTFSHSTVTHKTSTTHATFDDDFDPFGQSSPVTHTSHERDSELLLDFSSNAEIQNGETSGAVDHSSNPFSDMTTDTKSSNQFYDFGSGSANPLYDLASDSDADKSSNPLYEFTTTTTTTTTQQSPINPLYGAFDDSAIDEDAEESDLLSGTNERQGDEEEEEEDYVQSSRHHYDEGSHFQEQVVAGQQESFENSVSQYIDEGDHHELGTLHHEERHQDADEGRHYQEEEGGHYQEEQGRHYQEEEGGHYQEVEGGHYQEEEGRHYQEEEGGHQQEDDDNKYSTYEFVEEAVTHGDYHEGHALSRGYLAEEDAEEVVVTHSFVGGTIEEEDTPETSVSGMAAVGEEEPGRWRQEVGDYGGEDQYRRDRAEEDLENYCMNREDSEPYRPDRAEEDLENYCMNREDSEPYRPDRAEEDLENYCMNRGDSEPYRRDRAEEDLENYCMNREDSERSEEGSEAQAESIKSRDTRNRLSSGSVESWDVHATSSAPDVAVDDEVEATRLPEDRSRDLQQPDRPQRHEAPQGSRVVTKVTHTTETRYSVQLKYARPTVKRDSMPDGLDVTLTGVIGTSSDVQLRLLQHSVPDFPVYTLQVDEHGKFFTHLEELGVNPNVAYYHDLNNDAVMQVTRTAGRGDREDHYELQGHLNIEGQRYSLNPDERLQREPSSPSEAESYTLVPQEPPQLARHDHIPARADLDNSQASEDFSSNHWDEERSHQKADYDRPHQEEQDIIHFSETSTTRSKVEPDPTPAPRKQVSVHKEVHSPDAGVYESEPQTFQQWQNEAEDGDGVHESQPKKRDDVVREADTDKTADLPPVGTAQSMRARFMSSESTTHVKHESPNTAHHSAGGEYVSEPRGYVEKYEGKAESGVFESEPVHNPDVVRSGEELKEELPERGMAKNLANRFRQISTEGSSVSVTKSKREITPERPARVEHVSEHKSHQSVDYAVKVDAGVFENQPQRSADVVTSESVPDDYIPEKGFARNVAAKFREMESTVKSPTHSPIRKREITPPREDIKSHQAVVVENTPEVTSNIVHASDALEETLPERGMARNIALRFRQMEAENKSPGSPKAKKDLTPSPKDSGVYENQPRQFHADYSRPAESGFAENQPVRRDDVVRGDEPPKIEEELPERGAAKNLVNKWRQMESEGAKLKSPGSSGRAKDFTPVREDSRASQHKKSPRTPLSPSGHGQMDNGSVHPSDLPGQYQPQIEESVFESSPHERSDVVREADSDSTDGLPKKDTAKKMLARFQSIQAEANKQAPGPVSRKDSDCSENEIFDMMENAQEEYEDDNKVGRSKSMRAAIQTEKCGACDKTVYAMERLEMNKRVYHKACFRCTQCKAVLTPKTFAINNDIIFCTTHYKQLFATKGNYDEGFGRMQHKKRWNSNPNLTKDEEEDDKS